MSDETVKRLEDRIAGLGRESDLKLAAAIAKSDSRFEMIAASLTDLKSDFRVVQAEIRSEARNTRSVVLGAAVATIGVVLATMIGLKQVWVGGVQTGQTIQSAGPGATPSAPP